MDSCANYVHSSEKPTALVGVKDLIVVDSDDSVLIAKKTKSQEVKQVVEYLRNQKRSEHLHHRNVYIPSGSYDSIKNGSRYQVKELVVKSCAS